VTSACEKIVIVGGGIGGLAAALSLLKRGLDVEVYEQAPELKEVGAGIQISSNGTRVLYALGLEDPLKRVQVLPSRRVIRHWSTGETWNWFDLGAVTAQRYGTPHVMLHRGDLHGLLADAVRATKPDAVKLGRRCAGISTENGHAEVKFEDGEIARAAYVIGADGIHSKVRALTFGPERPRFTGCVAWRGLVPAERIRHLDIERASHNWMGPDGHVVHYWVSAGRFMNVVCVTEHGTWTSDSWTDKGKVADTLARYEGWHPTVRGLIEAFPETYIWALHDRLPLRHWTAGRATLLGDACHPMLPFMAQGAAQSIEDGAALASLLKSLPDDIPEALRRYEEIRKPRATRLQEASANNRTRFHLPDGPAQQARDQAMAASGDRSIANIGWLYLHDAADVG